MSMNTKEILIETDRYIYSNPITRSITLLGHRVCASLRKFDQPHTLVVDLGCGTGVHFKYIRKADFVGIDNMPEMVEKARETLNGNRRGVVLDWEASNLVLPSHSVDSMIASGILEHLPNLEEVLEEIKRVLKPNAELIVLQACEGFLYRLGRKFTTQRNIGPEYEEYITTEHTHTCGDVLGLLDKHFKRSRLVGVPFVVPSLGINAYIAGRYIKWR